MRKEKEKFLSEIKREISTWNIYSKDINGCTLEELKNFLKDVKRGSYDKLFEEPIHYSIRTIMNWHKERLYRQTYHMPMHPITKENYEVYQQAQKIKDHIQYMVEQYSLFHMNQTPPSEQELHTLWHAYQKMLMTDYSWEEKEKVLKEVKKLNYDKNIKFPHNVDEIIKAFFPHLKKIYPDYIEPIPNPLSMQEQAAKTVAYLRDHDIETLFTMPTQTKEEAYVRRMIISQLDIPKLVIKNSRSFLKPAMEQVEEDLNDNLTMSEITKRIIWKNNRQKQEIITPLVNGVLCSLLEGKKPLNIKKSIIETQRENRIVPATATESQRIDLAPYHTIYPIPKKEVPIFLQQLQNKYDHLYQTASDYEFLEGCIEITGELMMAQILRQGNKRTAKCLFNKMVLSRGLLPPIMDLTQNDYSLWYDFAESHAADFVLAKQSLLDQEQELSRSWKEDTFNMPVVIAPTTFNKSTIGKRYYKH